MSVTIKGATPTWDTLLYENASFNQTNAAIVRRESDGALICFFANWADDILTLDDHRLFRAISINDGVDWSTPTEWYNPGYSMDMGMCGVLDGRVIIPVLEYIRNSGWSTSSTEHSRMLYTDDYGETAPQLAAGIGVVSDPLVGPVDIERGQTGGIQALPSVPGFAGIVTSGLRLDANLARTYGTAGLLNTEKLYVTPTTGADRGIVWTYHGLVTGDLGYYLGEAALIDFGDNKMSVLHRSGEEGASGDPLKFSYSTDGGVSFSSPVESNFASPFHCVQADASGAFNDFGIATANDRRSWNAEGTIAEETTWVYALNKDDFDDETAWQLVGSWVRPYYALSLRTSDEFYFGFNTHVVTRVAGSSTDFNMVLQGTDNHSNAGVLPHNFDTFQLLIPLEIIAKIKMYTNIETVKTEVYKTYNGKVFSQDGINYYRGVKDGDAVSVPAIGLTAY